MESDADRSVAIPLRLAVKGEPVVKQEPEWDAAAARGDLYQDHEIKEELVIGPEILQQRDIANSAPKMLVKEEKYSIKLEPPDEVKTEPECGYSGPWGLPHSESIEQQFQLRSCFVKLEPIPLGDLVTDTCPMAFDCNPKHRYLPAIPAIPNQLCLSKAKPTKVDKSHICNICGKQFKRKSYLTSHILIHTGEKPFSCDICHKRFKIKSGLTAHLRSHMGEKPFRCEICRKQFRQKHNLTGHLRSHTGEKPFRCNECHKAFTMKSSLVSHLTLHLDEKLQLHSCKVCHKPFRKKSHLTSHILIHTGEKPFSCDICHKRFTQKRNLNSHLRSHTGEKPFSCNVCYKVFTLKSSLIYHSTLHMFHGCHHDQ